LLVETVTGNPPAPPTLLVETVTGNPPAPPTLLVETVTENPPAPPTLLVEPTFPVEAPLVMLAPPTPVAIALLAEAELVVTVAFAPSKRSPTSDLPHAPAATSAVAA
jgi:hypothetical protein